VVRTFFTEMSQRRDVAAMRQIERATQPHILCSGPHPEPAVMRTEARWLLEGGCPPVWFRVSLVG
jgi:hypothetical protein